MMASPSTPSSSNKHGNRSPDGDRRKKLLSHLEFWKEKEKTTSDLGTSPTTPSLLSSSPIPSQAKTPIFNYPSSNSVEGNININNNNNSTRNNKVGTAPTTFNSSNNILSNYTISGNTSPVRLSQEHLSNYNNNASSASNASSRNQSNPLSTSGPQTKTTNKHSTNLKSSSVDSMSPQNMLNSSSMQEPHKSPSTPFISSDQSHDSSGTSNYNKLTSSDTQPAASLIANRRSSLSERILLGLNNRPTKLASNLYVSDDDHASFLIQKLQELELRLNEVESQLRKETIKRIETSSSKYVVIYLNSVVLTLLNLLREFQQSLKRDGDRSGASEQILKGLEDYKSLETQYRNLIKEVSEYKQKLKEISHRLTSSGSFDGSMELNSKKR